MSRVGHYANFGAGNGGERKTSLRTKAKKTDSKSLKSDKARGVVGRRRKELEVAQGWEPRAPDGPSPCLSGAPPL